MSKKISDEQLDELIEEATIDVYDEYEQRSGYCVMLTDNLEFPFKAKVVGEEAEILYS